MYPEQPQAPIPPSGNNHYDFIMNPEKPQRRGLLGADPFITKIVIIVGGAVALMIVAAVVVNLFFGGKTNVESLVGLTQTQQEIVRLGAEGKDATDPQIRNAAVNTLLSLSSQQKTLLGYMGERGRTVKGEELNFKKDLDTDSALEVARQTSTFDTTYTATMRSLLEDYAGGLETAFKSASNQTQKDMLNKHYGDIQLLLKQWPS